MSNTSIKNNELLVHIEGESSVSTDVLVNIINDMSCVLKIAAMDKNVDASFQFKIKPFEPGSFIIPFVVNCANWYVEHSGTISDMLSNVKTLFEIKKFIKGNPPSEVIDNHNGTKTIINCNAESMTVNNYVYDCSDKVDKYISDIAQNVQNNSCNNGFSISSSNSTERFSPNDVNSMKKHIYNSANIKRMALRVNLRIIKPVFTGTAMWSFLYNDKMINAKMNDQIFLQNTQKGLVSFNANDSLDVELRYECSNPDDQSDNSEKYFIDKVYNHIPAQKYYQTSFENTNLEYR